MSNALDESVKWERQQAVKLAIDVGLAPFLAHVLTALSVVFVFWSDPYKPYVIFWEVCLILGVASHAFVVSKYRKLSSLNEVATTFVEKTYTVCGIIIGICWAGLFVLLFPKSAEYEIIYLAFAAGGLSMGAVATQHMLPTGVIAATSISLSCLALQFVLTGFPNGYFHAFCILLYLAVMIDLTFRLRKLSLKAARLQLEQRDLLEKIANERALRAQTNERQRVARDMHDTIGQWLSSLKMRLQTIGSQIEHGNTINQEKLTELVGDMDIIIDDTRRIARDLSPSSIAHKGFFAALGEHMAFLKEDHNVEVSFDIDETFELRSEVADHLYRIVQEASNNAVIHGDARHMAITLGKTEAEKIRLVIEDNGRGFDNSKKQTRHSLGLNSIRERTSIMDGVVTIKSAPNEGTRIEVLI